MCTLLKAGSIKKWEFNEWTGKNEQNKKETKINS